MKRHDPKESNLTFRIEGQGWVSDDIQKHATGFRSSLTRLGSGRADFKRSLMHEHADRGSGMSLEIEAGELKRLRWQGKLQACLKRIDKTPEQAAQDPKFADWKVAIATCLRTSTTAPNPWLAEALNMGAPRPSVVTSPNAGWASVRERSAG